MLAAATSTFAWAFARFTETDGYLYCAPVVVYGTIWILTVVFATGVCWSLAGQVGEWMAKPDPPEQPGDQHRPKSSPIQPRLPKPPRRVEITLVDMEPVTEITQPIPRMVLREWRPPVSSNSKENV